MSVIASMVPNTLAAPPMSILHLIHFGAGLEGNAATVKGDALADQHVGVVLFCRPCNS